MNKGSQVLKIPFTEGEWIIDTKNPGRPGQYTGNWKSIGNNMVMVQLAYPGGDTSYRPLSLLETMPKSVGTIEDKLVSGHFGKLSDLRRLITYEKLKGTLHEVIYSMEAAQIDFYPYQFKPVLKFINTPTERLIIADEVGLGKTIEAALIWMELQARRQASRLLVVCPKILANKWKDELRTKFLLNARMINFFELQGEVEELKRFGPSHSFALIATYTGLRPPRPELPLLKDALDDEGKGSPKTNLLREIRHWDKEYFPFDLVIFDEAHYMRNPATTTFHLGEALSSSAGAVLCVSATPVNNTNIDLHSLLRLVDEDFFETQAMFEDLLEANRSSVQAGNALARVPVDMEQLERAVSGMQHSPYINKSKLFEQFLERLEGLDANDKAQVAKCQDIAEKLNLLGNYVNRTRRMQVQEARPLRDAVVLEVDYTEPEMRLYQAILSMVRKMCFIDNRPFHIFQVMGLQLRAASCLPVIADEMRSGKFGTPEDLINESIGDLDLDEDIINELENGLDFNRFAGLLKYDFETYDSKYQKLKSLINEMDPDEKLLLFAYYRPTLAYLRRRLISDGLSVTIIHGGVPNEERWEELERFRDPHGPRIMLSSEVGSEGIDLQFCRVMINYDLPWNPMRVEQRIGRIDRIGQKAKKLSIVNFKIKGTIEERLYERLHKKLNMFRNSLGDLEAVVGKIVKELSIELLSKKLTPEQELIIIEQSEQVIEQRLLQIQALEESGDALIALSDYVQRKIEEDRDKGRYIQPEELEDYLMDFFERNFQGCEINHNHPANGCFRISLTHEAHASISEFIKDDRSLSASPFRRKDFKITFRRQVHQQLPANMRRAVHFTNHLSPLIRWITKINQSMAHSIFNVSALELRDSPLPLGRYCYLLERWRMSGLLPREKMAYGIHSLEKKYFIVGDEAESIVQLLLRKGHDWTYPEYEQSMLKSAYSELESYLAHEFDAAVTDFQAENDNAYQIKAQRVKNFFDRRIAQDQKRIESLHAANRSQQVINMAKKRLQNAQENRKRRLLDLKQKADPDFEQSPIAAGIFLSVP